MPFSHLPTALATFFRRLLCLLDPRPAARLPALLVGALFAAGRRTVTSWLRAAGVADDFRPCYRALGSLGHHTDACAVSALGPLEGLLPGDELTVALDDTPTARYGRHVAGAGIS